MKVEFIGYAPVDLAIEMHLLLKKSHANMVGEDMVPYEEHKKEYTHLTKEEKQ